MMVSYIISSLIVQWGTGLIFIPDIIVHLHIYHAYSVWDSMRDSLCLWSQCLPLWSVSFALLLACDLLRLCLSVFTESQHPVELLAGIGTQEVVDRGRKEQGPYKYTPCVENDHNIYETQGPWVLSWFWFCFSALTLWGLVSSHTATIHLPI